jgi:hypothetical protein
MLPKLASRGGPETLVEGSRDAINAAPIPLHRYAVPLPIFYGEELGADHHAFAAAFASAASRAALIWAKSSPA